MSNAKPRRKFGNHTYLEIGDTVRIGDNILAIRDRGMETSMKNLTIRKRAILDEFNTRYNDHRVTITSVAGEWITAMCGEMTATYHITELAR